MKLSAVTCFTLFAAVLAQGDRSVRRFGIMAQIGVVATRRSGLQQKRFISLHTVVCIKTLLLRTIVLRGSHQGKS